MIQKGIIKHICLNKISLCMFAFHVKDREKKTHKKLLFVLLLPFIFSLLCHKVRGCKRITDVLHLLCVFVIVLLICAFLSIFRAANTKLSHCISLAVSFQPFHHSSNAEMLQKSSYCVDTIFFLLSFTRFFFICFFLLNTHRVDNREKTKKMFK